MENISTFELWSQLVLPSITAVFLLLTTCIALWITWQSHSTAKSALEISVRANDWNKDQILVASRKEIADLIIAWSKIRFVIKYERPKSTWDSSTSELLERATIRLVQMKDGSSSALALYLTNRHKNLYRENPYVRAYVQRTIMVELKAILIIWATVPDCKELIEKIGDRSISELLEDARKYVQSTQSDQK